MENIDDALFGFDQSSSNSQLNLLATYKSLISELVKSLGLNGNMNTFSEDAGNNSNESFKGFDNDSGYISQAVGSNSLLDTGIDIRASEAVKSVYLNEDALLEKPKVPTTYANQSGETEEYQEFDHLFFMSDSSALVLNSSVASQKTEFSGFGCDESTVSDTSNIVPIATPLKLSTSIRDFNSHEDLPKCTEYCKEPDKLFCDGKENNANYLNLKSNLNQVNPENENIIQTEPLGLVDNNINDSSFESFYSHFCGLLTRNYFPSENSSKSVNSDMLKKDQSCNSPYKHSYLQLESSMESLCNSQYLNSLTKENTTNSHRAEETRYERTLDSKVDEKMGVCNINKDTEVLPLSPELFSDEETLEQPCNTGSFVRFEKSFEQKSVTKTDRELLQRAQESLCGVLPPPSVTIVQMSVHEMLQKINENKHLFFENVIDNLDIDKNTENKSEINKSLLVTCKEKDFATAKWPDIMNFRYHGLHFNRSKVSEDFEHLCLKYAERYIGAETQSVCSVFGTNALSPSKRKFKRAARSPGKRLSHLARRRITFSKDSLQSINGSASCSFIGARTRQIMVDARKSEMLYRRSPKKKTPKKTPGKSPRRKLNTSGNSSKKGYMTRYSSNDESSISSVMSSSSRASVSKRALFQSPDKGETTNGLLQILSSDISNDSFKSVEFSRKKSPRRALFNSPIKSSPSKMSISCLYPARRKLTPKRALFTSPEKRTENLDRKRKRIDSEGELSTRLTYSATDLSFESKTNTKTLSLSKTSSQTQTIIAHRKKKMIWSVANALHSQNIDLNHPQFKIYASMLARLIRHFLPGLFTNGPRPEGSSTASMVRVARQHVFAVTRGKTVEQIIREVESKVQISKPTGYIAPNKLDKPSESIAKNKENVLQDRINIINETSQLHRAIRPANVERIRRVINFGDEDDQIR